MPTKPKVPCKHPGCPNLVPSGTKYCDAHKALHPEDIPHRGDEKLFWDRSNWRALCKRCHDQKTRREDQTPTYHY